MAELGVPPAYGADGRDHPLPDGLYILKNKISRTVIDLYAGIPDRGTRCAGFPRNTDGNIDHQLWIIKCDTSNNTYTLKNHRGGTYLDLEAGKRENGSRVCGYPRTLEDGGRRNQEWRIIEQDIDEDTLDNTLNSYYRIQNIHTDTYLEIPGGNPSMDTIVACSTKIDGGDHQLWIIELPYGDDAEYFVLPSELRRTIWDGTNLQSQKIRRHVFDYDDFVIKAKEAVGSWARGRLRDDEYSVLFGVVYGNARRGPKAYNWYLSNDLHDLVFLDSQTGREFTPAAMNAFGFEPTMAIF
ncbi:hypothetical protein FRC04_004671 [Tulasnella sp. 424]|nr:hypothetical protein FRC04_004671 [Tulasnella sp. 424]